MKLLLLQPFKLRWISNDMRNVKIKANMVKSRAVELESRSQSWSQGVRVGEIFYYGVGIEVEISKKIGVAIRVGVGISEKLGVEVAVGIFEILVVGVEAGVAEKIFTSAALLVAA